MAATLEEMGRQIDSISGMTDTLIAERDKLREALIPFAKAAVAGGHYRYCKALFSADEYDASECNCAFEKAKAALRLCGVDPESIRVRCDDDNDD